MSDHWEAPPCTGASGIGLMDTSPEADAISILTWSRTDESSTEGSEAA